MSENTPPRLNILYQDELVDYEAIMNDLVQQYIGIDGNGECEVGNKSYDDEIADEETDEGADEEGQSSQPVFQIDATLTFQGHCSKRIRSCSLNPVFKLAATCGEDKLVFVWCIQTGAVIKVINVHRDIVTEVHWSRGGMYLATKDLCGVVLIHKLQNGAWHGLFSLIKICSFLTGELRWMRWHIAANILLAGSRRGEVHAWSMPSGDCTTLPGPGVSCNLGALTDDDNMLFTGYGNGLLMLWDLTTYATVLVVDDQHMTPKSGLLTAIACHKDAPFYMSADMSGKIAFTSQNGPLGTVTASGPVDTLVFSPATELKLAASTTMDGHIQIWNFTTFSLHMQFKYNPWMAGIINIDWISNQTLLGRGRLGEIFGYDVRSGLRKFTLSGHDCLVEDLEYDLSEGVLLSVGGSEAKIFKLPQLDD